MGAFARDTRTTQQTPAAKSSTPGQSHSGQGREVNSILHLQRTIGNQAVRRLLEARRASARIQAKLEVNAPGDVYEQEADRIADQVMRMPEPKLQRACACGGGCSTCQTEQPDHERERLQTKRIQAGEMGRIAAPPSVREVLAAPGQSLDEETRGFMEQRFGYDFSKVRVHSDATAEQSAHDVGAHAYTVGHDIVFGAGRFAPGTHEGRRLIAHELTHVVQQSGADGMGVGQSTENRGLSPDAPTGSDPYSRSPEMRKDRSVRGLSPWPGRASLNRRVLQRRVLDDISIDSADFWTHLRTRTFTRLVAWIGDSRQKLNAFMATMGESDTPSEWGAVVQSWIGVFGTPGDIVNALITSLTALTKETDSPLTLSQLRAQLERNFDNLSTQVNDMNSDLPIYRALRHAESQEFVRATPGPVTMGERQAKKGRAKEALETALSALPTANALERSLVLHWIKAARNAPGAGGDPHILHRTRYELAKNSRPVHHPPGFEVWWSVRELENVSNFKPVIRVPTKMSGRQPLPYVNQTLKALRTAYGDSYPIDQLGLPMRIEFMVIPSYYGDRRRLDRAWFSWSYEPRTKSWAPTTGLGEAPSEDRSAWPEDAQNMVINDWKKNGRKPTVAEIGNTTDPYIPNR